MNAHQRRTKRRQCVPVQVRMIGGGTYTIGFYAKNSPQFKAAQQSIQARAKQEGWYDGQV
jgi:hypothetical protein